MSWKRIMTECKCNPPEPTHPIGSSWVCDNCGCEWQITTLAGNKFMTPNKLLWRYPSALDGEQ